jgi:hypothetical protein
LPWALQDNCPSNVMCCSPHFLQRGRMSSSRGLGATTVTSMGLIYRRRIALSKTAHVNVSKSGVSATKKIGRVSLNTRGRGSIRLGKGLSFRFKL